VDRERRDYLVEEHKIPIGKITVLHNAVDTDKFFPVSDQEKASIRRRLGLPESKLLVLIPARFSPEKGVVFAAQASARLKENNDMFFLFIGGGPQRNEIESITQAQRNTLILDAISHDEFDLYFKAADIVLLPSIPFNNVREGTSMSLLEGMACGKIVISTRVGGMAEVIENGYSGFFVEQESSKSIADILMEFSKDFSQYNIIGANASRVVRERYSFELYVEKMLTIYKQYLIDSESDSSF
jgi:glycosyltransferase involved in cell wall biosynthesis